MLAFCKGVPASLKQIALLPNRCLSSSAASEKMGKASPQSSYRRLEKIGAGTYGKVYKAALLGKDGKQKGLVALKKIKATSREEGIPSTAMREVALLKEMSHPNIIKIMDVVHSSPHLFLVFEFATSDLRKFIDKQDKGRLSQSQVKSFMAQILEGMAYCHSHCIIHRDLKPQNILVDQKGVLKIADFGLSRPFGVPVRAFTHEVVTLWYRAPEILLGLKEYWTAIDIWSIGCIMVEMATGRPLFAGDSEIDELMRIFRTLGTPDNSVWPGVTGLPFFQSLFPKWSAQKQLTPHLCEAGDDLARRLLCYNPRERCTAKQALRHRYLSNSTEGVNATDGS